MDAMTIDSLVADLKVDEGYRGCVYQDGNGYWTIGYGTLVDARVAGCKGLPEHIAAQMLADKATSVIGELKSSVGCWPRLSHERQKVLANMGYQIGVPGLMRFQRMLAALDRGDYDAAASEMVNSLWYRQTQASRKQRLVNAMRKG